MKSFFERIGTVKKKFRVDFILQKLTTNMTNLNDSIIIQIKRGSHKQQTQPLQFEQQTIEFGKQQLTFDPVTMYYDEKAKIYTSKEGEIRVVIVKGDDKKVGGVIAFDLAEHLNQSPNPEGIKVHVHKKGEVCVGKSSKAKFKLTYQIYLKFIRQTNSEADSDLEVMISNKLGKKKDKQKQKEEQQAKSKEGQKVKDKNQRRKEKQRVNQKQTREFKSKQKEKEKEKEKKPSKRSKQIQKQDNNEEQESEQREKKDKKRRDKRQYQDGKQKDQYKDQRDQKKSEDKKQNKKKDKEKQKQKKQKVYESMSEQQFQQVKPRKIFQKPHKKNNSEQQIDSKKPSQKEEYLKQQGPIQTVSLDDIFKNMIEETPTKNAEIKKSSKIQKPAKPRDQQNRDKANKIKNLSFQIPEQPSQQHTLTQQPSITVSSKIKPKTPKIIQNKSLSDKQSFYQQQIQKLEKLKRQLMVKNTDLKEKQKQLKQQIRQSEQFKDFNIKNIRATTFNTVEESTKIIKQLQTKIKEVDKQNSVQIIKCEELKTKYQQALSTVQLDKIEAQNQIKQKEQEHKKELSSLDNTLKQLKDKEGKMIKELENLKNEKIRLSETIERINSSSDITRERHAEQLLNDEKRKIMNALNAASQEGNLRFIDFIEKHLPTT